MKICIIVPSYRDADRLEKYLPDLCRLGENFELLRVIVVDDGSGPEHSSNLRNVVDRCRTSALCDLRLHVLSSNVGKGGAIYAGWDASLGFEWLGFVDADGATSAKEVSRMLHFLKQTLQFNSAPDMIIASRVKMLGRTVDRSAIRHFMGRVYSTLASILTGLSVYDSQCGCKFIRIGAYSAVRLELNEKRFAFDMELLLYLSQAGFSIIEFPVDWRDVAGSKVSLFKDSFLMFRSLLSLRKSLPRRPSVQKNPMEKKRTRQDTA
jgi:dolichyl-phosphate beta-glucosyltransferase